MYKYDDKTKTLTVTKYNDLWYYSFLEEKKDFIQKIVINDTEHIEPYDLCNVLSQTDYNTVENIEICADNPQYESIDGVVYIKPLRWTIFCPKGKTGSVHIADGTEKIRISAFRKCKISSVYLPDSVKIIGEGAFTFCSLLKEVCGGKNVKIIEYCAFRGCVSLESFCFSNILQEIGDQAFEGTKLKQVSFCDKLEKIGAEAFYGCDIKSVTLPESIKEIGTSALLHVAEIHAKTYDNIILAACTCSRAADIDDALTFTMIYIANCTPIAIPKCILETEKLLLNSDIQRNIHTEKKTALQNRFRLVENSRSI